MAQQITPDMEMEEDDEFEIDPSFKGNGPQSVPVGWGAGDINREQMRRSISGAMTEAAPDIGAALGGIGGAALLKGFGAYPGTAIGTLAGLGVQRAMQGAAGQPQRPWSEAPQEVAKQLAFQGVGDVVSGGFTMIGNRLVKVKPEHLYENAKDAAKTAEEWGAPLTPAQASRVGLGRSIESTAASTWTGKGPIRARYQVQQEVLGKKMDELFTQYAGGGDRYELSGQVNQLIKEGEESFRNQAAKDYADLDTVASSMKTTRQVTKPSTIVGPNGQPIPVTTVVTDDKIIPSTSIKKQATNAADMFELKSPIESVLRQVEAVGDNMSFMEAHNLRSDLLATLRKMPETSSKRVRAATMVKDEIEKKMEEAAKKGGGSLWTQYRKVSDAYREGSLTLRY